MVRKTMPSVHDPEEQAGAEARPEEPDQSLEAAPRPWWQRRRYQVAVAFGVAAAVGTTGVLVAQHVGAVHHDVASETRAGGTSADPRDDGPEARAGAAKPGKAGARAPGKKGA